MQHAPGRYVLINMLIQFAVALVSWLSVGVAFPMSNDAAKLINLVAFWVLLGLLLLSRSIAKAVGGRAGHLGLEAPPTASS